MDIVKCCSTILQITQKKNYTLVVRVNVLSILDLKLIQFLVGLHLVDLDRNQVEIEKQSKLNGFELFTINEWSVFDN
jgi:hypothetical protein